LWISVKIHKPSEQSNGWLGFKKIKVQSTSLLPLSLSCLNLPKIIIEVHNYICKQLYINLLSLIREVFPQESWKEPICYLKTIEYFMIFFNYKILFQLFSVWKKNEMKIFSRILFAVILISTNASIQTKCICSNYSGIFCGDRSKQNILKGDCDFNMIYQCIGYNTEALPKGLCNKCYKNRIFGTDFCDVIKQCKLSLLKVWKRLSKNI
jgi:hypothetical protein